MSSQSLSVSRRNFLAAAPLPMAAAFTAMPAEALSLKVSGSWINVQDYGAIGDGINNDAPAINLAIQAAAAGDVVYIPKGTYFCASSIVINKTIKLTGDFHAGTQLKFAPSITGITISSAAPPGLNGVSIMNLSLRSQGGTGANGVAAHSTELSNGLGYIMLRDLDIALFTRAISFRFCQICSIQSCHVYFCQIGVYLKRCVNVKLFDVVSEVNSKWGLFIDGDLGAITDSCGTLISQCQFFNNGETKDSTFSGNIYVYANENFELTGCMIDVPAPSSTHNLVTNHTHRANVANCWIGASKGNNIDLISSSEIVITCCNIVTATNYGVAINSSSFCMVSSCTIRQSGTSDVIVYGLSNGSVISSNTCISSISSSPAVIESSALNTICNGNIVNRSVNIYPGSVNNANLLV